MSWQAIKHNYDEIMARVRILAMRLDAYTAGFAGLVYYAIKNFASQGLREAAALAYYALFSFFPLVLLIIVIIGWIIGPSAVENQGTEDFLSFFLPGATATELNRMITTFIEQGSSASIVAVIGLSWSALGFFSNLESALSRTFRDTQGRPYLQRRAIGLGMILALGVLLTANIITSLLFSLLDLFFLTRGNLWLSIAGTFVPFGFSMGIFAMLYRWLPRSRVGWDAIWPAALLGALAWESAKRFFVWYLDTLSNLSLVYGSIITVIVFMLWTFYTACIILLAAEFCVSLADWLEKRKQQIPEEEQHEFAADYYRKALGTDLH